MKYDGRLRTIELNGAHVDVYKHSVIFYDDKEGTEKEYTWKDLYKLTKGDL